MHKEDIIVNKLLDKVIKELRQKLTDYYGDKLYKVVLYGSQARGDSVDGSDVDVLVVLSGDVNPYQEIINTEDIVSEISLNHTVVIACVFVSRDRYETHRGPLLKNIRREGIAI